MPHSMLNAPLGLPRFAGRGLGTRLPLDLGARSESMYASSLLK